MTTAGQRPAGKPRPVKAAAGELVEVRLTVNGTPAVLNVPARLTFADALREHLGLTGTHLGCEHGVCGMCTVVLDGEAARACLLFAVQLDGADVLTVEGLGRPDDLHPLQQSFGRNHALQCGFCTPGFLMSSYDLLTNRPEVTEQELPEELSGVICRCTGYKNILAAVTEAQRAHPEGMPAPGNRARRALVGRATPQAGSATDGRAPAEDNERGGSALTEIVLPAGDPTIAVEIRTDIAAAVDKVWQVLADERRLARCLPGAELTEDLGDNHYAGRARVSLGPIKLAFHGVAHIVERDRQAQRMRVLARGQDTGGAQTLADIVLRTESTPRGTALHADAKVYLTGRIAQFGRALAGDVSRRMFEQFGEAVEQAAVSGGVPPAPRKPPGAVAMMAGTLAAKARESLRRLYQRLRPRR